MFNKVQITIPTPCHEKWEAMLPTDKGRFCASCQKNVIDFTKASDRQIAAAYKKDAATCGLFLDTQLNRDLIIPKEKNRFWAAASAAAISFFAFGTGQAIAQDEPVNTEETVPEGVANRTIVFNLSGTVLNKYNRPISGVRVTLKNSSEETFTDAEGHFTISAPPGSTLKFTGDNLKPLKLNVTNETEYKIALRFKKVPKATHVMGSPRYF